MTTPSNQDDVLEDFFASLDITDEGVDEGKKGSWDEAQSALSAVSPPFTPSGPGPGPGSGVYVGVKVHVGPSGSTGVVDRHASSPIRMRKVRLSSTPATAVGGIYGCRRHLDEHIVDQNGQVWTFVSGPWGGPSSSRSGSRSQHRVPSQKQSLVGRAEEGQNSWAEFKVGQGASSIGAKPISFSLNQQGKKTKKAPKHARNQNPTIQTFVDFNGTSEEKTNDGASLHQCQRPRWTAIIDTCCLLDDGGECIRQILRLAKSAHHVGDSDPECAMTAASLDDIRLVIPHVLWAELDGIAKRPQGRRFRAENGEDALEEAEELSRKARAATRLLQDEMEAEAAALQSAHLLGAVGNLLGVGHHQRVLLSQTMEEMKNASEKYLPPNSHVVNDDHILACVLAYRAKDAPEGRSPVSVAASPTAGGTIVLTNDRNLSCKALANNIRVFSPEEFWKHISLRSEVRKDLLKQQHLPHRTKSG